MQFHLSSLLANIIESLRPRSSPHRTGIKVWRRIKQGLVKKKKKNISRVKYRTILDEKF